MWKSRYRRYIVKRWLYNVLVFSRCEMMRIGYRLQIWKKIILFKFLMLVLKRIEIVGNYSHKLCKGISIIKLRRNISFPNGEITHHQMKVYADFFRQSKSKRELSLSFWLWRLLFLSIVEWITLAISLFFISYFFNRLKWNHHHIHHIIVC